MSFSAALSHFMTQIASDIQSRNGTPPHRTPIQEVDEGKEHAYFLQSSFNVLSSLITLASTDPVPNDRRRYAIEDILFALNLNESSSPSLTQSTLHSRVVTPEDVASGDVDRTRCHFCLEDYNVGERVMFTSCCASKLIHMSCMTDALSHSHRCAFCRSSIG
jgi:hypothetical protein